MNRKQNVSLDEAYRGIFIDFEGNIDRPPSILGVLIEDDIRHFIVENALSSFSKLSNPRYQVTVASLDEALLKIVLTCETENRGLYGYSIHDLSIVEHFATNTHTIDWFRASYVNAKKPIDRYISHRIRKGEMDALEDKTLATRMPLVGIKYEPGCGSGIVGPGLSRLRNQVTKRDSVNDIPKGAKSHWWRILSHNSSDLMATKKLLVTAAQHLIA